MKDSKLLALILTVSLPTAHCLVHLFNVCHTFPLITYYFREFGLGSTNNPMTDIFLYSHHTPASYCIDIVGRNFELVTHEI